MKKTFAKAQERLGTETIEDQGIRRIRTESRAFVALMMSDHRVSVGSLFAAIGGFAHAFRSIGVPCLWASDCDRFASSTFHHNLADVRLLEKSIESLSVFGDQLEPVDVLTAGFPCQPFSVAGEKRGLDDARGVLFLDIVRLIGEFGRRKPKVLLLENVKHLKSHDDGRTFQRIETEIQRAGYWFSSKNARVLNTLDYSSIPQNRERLFMVALNTHFFRSASFHFPEPNRPRQLAPIEHFLDTDVKSDDYFYFPPSNQYHKLFVEAISKGGDAIYQLRRNYVRRNMSGTCFTLMANMGDGGHNQPVIRDQWGIRKLTPIECARLQGYDEKWFSFPADVSIAQRYKQIGNSVTVPVVRSIASEIVSLIGKECSRGMALTEVAS